MLAALSEMFFIDDKPSTQVSCEEDELCVFWVIVEGSSPWEEDVAYLSSVPSATESSSVWSRLVLSRYILLCHVSIWPDITVSD